MMKEAAACIFLLLLASSAGASPELYSIHHSITGMKDGHSDLSDARLFGLS
ncbi:MAG: hypothetical protein IJR85_01715 [Synergistaceae bacterium]|nr:hypothetical protein [Synergistaceae bacterium]